MANVYFSNLKQLEEYREEGFAANMLDVRAACPTLKALLKPEEPGIYRTGKSVVELIILHRMLSSDGHENCLIFC